VEIKKLVSVTPHSFEVETSTIALTRAEEDMMSKQILKGFTMLVLVVGLAFVSAVVSANGQSSTAVRGNVPFEFIVGDQSLPAGEYTVKSISSGGEVLAIANRDLDRSTMRMSRNLVSDRKSETPRLIFHRYGNQNFLAEVWAGEQTGKQLAKSKQERAIEREQAAIAANGKTLPNTYETVVILASLR
jgi:hypothetical protein